jgi:hypothetical protein
MKTFKWLLIMMMLADVIAAAAFIFPDLAGDVSLDNLSNRF